MPGEAPAFGYAPPPTSGGPQYPPPPGGTYPPPGQYPPVGGPGPGVPPPGYATNDEKTWALIAHFGGALGVFVGGGILGWVAPLVAMMSKGNESPTVRAHAVGALNHQITWAIAVVIGWVLTTVTCGILFFVPLLAMLVPIIFGIIGGVKANEGVLYRYPATVTIVK